MDSVAEKFSIFDYFNLLIGGAVFLFGIGICGYPETGECLLAVSSTIGDSDLLLFIGITLFIGVSFVVGTIINEIGHWIFKEKLEWEGKWVRTCLTDVDVVGNEVKLNRYKQKASALFFSQDSDVHEDYSPEQCSSFFAYCVYYIQVRNQDKKTERLREVRGLSSLLTCVFALIPAVSIALSILFPAFCDNMHLKLMEYVICILFSVVFARKQRRDIKNRIRMVLAVYDVCTEMEEHNMKPHKKGRKDK